MLKVVSDCQEVEFSLVLVNNNYWFNVWV